jgi:hypothetical protein
MNSTLTNKKRQITYEELMDSHFMKHPSHSRIVHVIFSPPIVAAIILVVTTGYVKIADGDWAFALTVGALCSMYLFIKILMITPQMTGHGVGLVKKGKFSVLGLTSIAVAMFTVILFLISAITVLGYIGGFERAHQLGESMLFGFVMAMLSWRFHSYYETWYGSEYDARVQFKNKGNSDEVIEGKIKKLKKRGIIP